MIDDNSVDSEEVGTTPEVQKLVKDSSEVSSAVDVLKSFSSMFCNLLPVGLDDEQFCNSRLAQSLCDVARRKLVLEGDDVVMREGGGRGSVLRYEAWRADRDGSTVAGAVSSTVQLRPVNNAKWEWHFVRGDFDTCEQMKLWSNVVTAPCTLR